MTEEVRPSANTMLGTLVTLNCLKPSGWMIHSAPMPWFRAASVFQVSCHEPPFSPRNTITAPASLACLANALMTCSGMESETNTMRSEPDFCSTGLPPLNWRANASRSSSRLAGRVGGTSILTSPGFGASRPALSSASGTPPESARMRALIASSDGNAWAAPA